MEIGNYTLSRFAPFWVFRIVGFRRLPQSEAR